MSRIGAAFGRLSRREKLLVGSLGLVLFLGIVGAASFVLGSEIGVLEEQIEEDRATLKKIYAKSGGYLEAVAKTEKMRSLAAQNEKLNLKLSINELAKRVTFEAIDRQGNPTGSKRLSDVMQYQLTQETFLSRKKKKAGAKKKKDETTGYYRRDQKVTLSDTVPFDAIFQFLEKVEGASDMLFVTDLELRRDFRQGNVAQRNATITVSTFYYKGPEVDPDAEPVDKAEGADDEGGDE